MTDAADLKPGDEFSWQRCPLHLKGRKRVVRNYGRQPIEAFGYQCVMLVIDGPCPGGIIIPDSFKVYRIL